MHQGSRVSAPQTSWRSHLSPLSLALQWSSLIRLARLSQVRAEDEEREINATSLRTSYPNAEKMDATVISFHNVLKENLGCIRLLCQPTRGSFRDATHFVNKLLCDGSALGRPGGHKKYRKCLGPLCCQWLSHTEQLGCLGPLVVEQWVPYFPKCSLLPGLELGKCACACAHLWGCTDPELRSWHPLQSRPHGHRHCLLRKVQTMMKFGVCLH